MIADNSLESLTKDQVKEYYGKVLSSKEDLKTTACCTDEGMPDFLKKAVSKVHTEVLNRFYGCGLIAPSLLEGMRVLDLGSGSGRDCYVLSQLVGESGSVVGVDMTEEQLKIARQYQDFHAKAFGYAQSNVEFKQGYIERLDELDLEDNSFDIIISNCVINLSPDKEATLREAYRVLKPGGEMYFSDVYSDRRIGKDLRDDPVLFGECLSGALYWNDFLTLSKKVGFHEPRLVEDRPLGINNSEIEKVIGHINFYSATYRLWKLPELEGECEDFGQSVIYKGTIPNQEEVFYLDKEHAIEKGKEFKVCGNTYRMLNETRLAPHFEFKGNWSEHFGIFNCCGQGIPFDSEGESCEPGGACCVEVEPLPSECEPGGSCCAEVEPSSKASEPSKKKSVGYIQPHALKELWFNTGSICNLSCSFCFEESKPGDNRLNRISLEEAKQYIDESLTMGVERISFTGGEPFVNKEIFKILDYALDKKPCMVLTNGTDPILKQMAQLATLKSKPYSLSLRVSVDSPEEEVHDSERGIGSFKKAFLSLQKFNEMGFEISIARHSEQNEDKEKVEVQFKNLFKKHDLPEDLPMVSFVDLHPEDKGSGNPNVTENCMTTYHTEESRLNFMCAYSKMVVKKDGEMKVLACTLVSDDPNYEMGETLKESMDQRVEMNHQRCYSCFASGTSCSG